jgi:hypothetical protein
MEKARKERYRFRPNPFVDVDEPPASTAPVSNPSPAQDLYT